MIGIKAECFLGYNLSYQVLNCISFPYRGGIGDWEKHTKGLGMKLMQKVSVTLPR